MLGFNGGLIGVRKVPTTGSTSGLWFQNEQSVAKRAGIWPAGADGDPSFANVSLLLHLNGSNGSTTFTDSSSNALTVTASGNAQISTAQSKFGGSSAVFDGTGDCLSTTISGGLGSGAFTIEFWFYRSNSSGIMFNSRTVGVGADGIDIYADGRVSTYSNWIFGDAAVTSIQNNTWTHFAVTRDSSNVMRRFLDGTQAGGDSTIATDYSGSAMEFGGSINMNSGFLEGNLDEIRITKNVARYTASFTPPATPFPDA